MACAYLGRLATSYSSSYSCTSSSSCTCSCSNQRDILHFNDANQEGLAVGKCQSGRLVQEASDIEDGSTFHGGATSDGAGVG